VSSHTHRSQPSQHRPARLDFPLVTEERSAGADAERVLATVGIADSRATWTIALPRKESPARRGPAPKPTGGEAKGSGPSVGPRAGGECRLFWTLCEQWTFGVPLGLLLVVRCGTPEAGPAPATPGEQPRSYFARKPGAATKRSESRGVAEAGGWSMPVAAHASGERAVRSVSRCHRGCACSARRPRASRTSWSRSASAGRPQ
jgi:hypothetical protein